MEKEYQRKKLYKSEDNADVYLTPPLLNIASAQNVINLWLKDKWLLKRYPFMKNKKILVKHSYSGKTWGSHDTISLGLSHYKLGILAHEFAHSVHKNKWPEEASHGWRFVNIYMLLSKHFISKEFTEKLKYQCNKNKVKYYESQRK